MHKHLINSEALNSQEPSLDWKPILEIHRGDPNGFVGFGRKREGYNGIEHVGAVQVQDIQEMLPGILKQFVSYDGYFTVNSYYRAGAPWKKMNNLPYLLRDENMLLELGACYADLDVGRPDGDEPGARLSWQDAQVEVLRRQNEGLIPAFSMLACSGRGVYVFWLLRDEDDPTKLPRAYGSRIIRYKAINNALHERLFNLAPDKRSKDAARFLRVPGSIHTKVMKRVTYSLTMQGNDEGRLTYSLHELEDFLRITAPAPSLPADLSASAQRPYILRGQYRKTKERGSRPQNRKGYIRTNELRALDLETIEAWRGSAKYPDGTTAGGWLHAGKAYPDGFVSPGRGLMLRLYAQWLRGAGKNELSVLDSVQRMAQNCNPPYPSDSSDMKVASIVHDAFSAERKRHIKNIRNDTWTDEAGGKHPGLCDWLGISDKTDPELVKQLKTILPENERELRALDTPRRQDFTEERQTAIRKIVDMRQGNIPEPLKMQRLLDDMDIINPTTTKPWSDEIIRQDYKALGYPDARPGRRRRSL